MKSRWFRMRRVLALAAAISPLFVITAWGLLLVFRPSASLAGQSSTGEIASFLGNLCLQPANESSAQGAAIVQEACNGQAAQQWTKVLVSGDTFHYVNGLSGLCLDARGGAANHTPIQQWPCNKISNENWQSGEDIDETIPPLISRVSGTSNYCLDEPGGQAIPGLAIQIYRCNKSLAQDWYTP
jgi:hypothetical protein